MTWGLFFEGRCLAESDSRTLLREMLAACPTLAGAEIVPFAETVD
jgi:hypothetical protein